MMHKKSLAPVFLSLLLLALSPGLAHAAFSGVVLTPTPAAPAPGDRVTIKAAYLGFEAGRFVFTWVIDGDQVQEGVGADEFALDAPEAGESTEITVTVADGVQVLGSNTLTLHPAGLEIEWEGDGATTPFGGVRPLLTGHGRTRAIAVPDFRTRSGARIANENIYFEWEVNGVIDKKASGYGKTSLVAPAPFYDRAYDMSVKATSRDGTLRGEKQIRISPLRPSLVVYRTSPLTGVEDGRAIQGSYEFVDSEVTFIAYPLHAAQSAAQFITWELNQSPVDAAQGDRRVVTFRKTAEGHGQYGVEAGFTDPALFLNKAAMNFLIHF